MKKIKVMQDYAPDYRVGHMLVLQVPMLLIRL